MSRFEAAAKKAAAASSKAAAKPAAAKAGPGAKASAPAPINFKSVDEMRKFVASHEHKIDDMAENAKNESNNKLKKDHEAALKKLQKDENYVKALEGIKEAEAQAKKDAERAAIHGKDEGSGKAVAPKAKAASGSSAKASAATKAAKVEETLEAPPPTEATMQDIDAALSSKDNTAKVNALRQLEALADVTALVLPRLQALVGLFADTKAGPAALKAAKAILANMQPKGHAMEGKVVPILLGGVDAKVWKTKAPCIDLLLPCLQQMAEATPVALADTLPAIVARLAEAALEVKAEIRTATGAVLRHIGTLVASPEIQKLSQDLVTALAEPANQKHTQAVLAKMGNQTFMSLIGPASLALIMPVVTRGLKEREPMSKKWSAQIFGSMALLVQDVEFMKPYLKQVYPMLQEALTDPSPEVQREAAKCFGVLEQVLPQLSRESCQPWLFMKLAAGEPGEQIGASLALAQVFVKMDKAQAAKFVPAIQAGAANEKPLVRKGFLELMDAMPQAMKMDFVPYLQACVPLMLTGINGDKDELQDPGWRAASAAVHQYGNLCPELLLPAFEGTLASALAADSSEAKVRQQVVREKTVTLLGKVAEKILEFKRFGQDLLSTEDCSTKETREYLACLSFLMRWDADPAVKRIAGGIWKNIGGAPKMQKAIMGGMEKLLARWRTDMGKAAQKLALEVQDALAKTGDLEAFTGDAPDVGPLCYPVLQENSDAESASIVAGHSPVGADDTEVVEGPKFERQPSTSGAISLLEGHECLSSMPFSVREFIGILAESLVREGRKKKKSGHGIATELAEHMKTVLSKLQDVPADVLEQLPEIAERQCWMNSSGTMGAKFVFGTFIRTAQAAVRAELRDAYDAEGAGDADDEETLLRAENLLLMYGGGKLLLKDTMLEMKRNCRYGVVGQNGAGKTTLMKEIAGHRIVGMPATLKCVHVDDSKLGVMSDSTLSSQEYVMKMAKDIGVTIDKAGSRDMLLSVGFNEKKLDDPVSELSTGWRMRLTLAVSMLKHADLVLLDEPTNHLDEESVAWLAEYIMSIKQSSVMVISHEPKFLNKICTHVVAYVDKKLEYTEGNFEVFAQKKGLTQEQLDAMLSGNLSFDTKKAEDEEEDAQEGGLVKVNVAAPVAGPPKLTFPIPGTMEGVKTGSRAVLELKKISFRWGPDKDYLIKECSGKLTLSSRVAICGRNGCGKSTLMTLLCSEMSPSENADGSYGEVWRHCNLRLAYMKQDHLTALGPFFDTSPFNYITQRFKDGYDGDLQRRLVEPEDEEEATRRKKLAKEHGKYGNEVDTLLSRSKLGNQLHYEVKWKGLDDPKQNTMEPISKLKAMGLDKVVIACDERIAAKAAGLEQRPLTRREIVKHCEAFGIDEEMCCNQQIRGFSAGQKVRLSLAAMFWTKPHFIALDEPTNYLDVETVEAMVKALTTFRGGIIMIEPKTDFVEKICNERWLMEDAVVTVQKMQNGVKRQA